MSELIQSLLENLRIAIAVVGRDGSIHYRNRGFDQSLGEGAEEWVRDGARALAGERGWLQGFFADPDSEHEVEVDHHGRTYKIHQIPASITESEVALSFEDITRNREIEQAKSDFTSMIVHDLRGPLSGIQGTLEFILAGETKLDPMHLDLLQESMRESERMMGLVDEILDFSKIESGNFKLEKEPVHLGSILKRCVHSLQQAAAREQVMLLSAHGIDLPMVMGNSEKLTQVVINLLSNALKFTPKNGVIAVGARVIRDTGGSDAIAVSVTDTGTGIREEDQQLLFRKYKQARGKSIRGGGGTGLGLYIVKELVEAHGGAITLSSVEGVGTSMVFTLPISRSAVA